MSHRDHWNSKWNAHTGWHHYHVACGTGLDHYHKYNQVVDWILATVGQPKRDVRWCMTDQSGVRVKFRKSQDFALFLLRWA